MKYMLDTNVFNKLLDGDLVIEKMPSDGTYVATHVQRDELNASKDISRRTALLSKFEELSPKQEITASFCFDISRFDHAAIGDGLLFTTLKNALDAANGGKRNNTHDALIGETSIVNDFTLLTCDFDFAEAVKQQGGLVIYFEV